MTRLDYRAAIDRTGIMECLQDFSPKVAGTPPLGLDMPDSDIDILCHAPNANRFSDRLWQAFSDCPDFRLRQWTGEGRPVIASFQAEGWLFEVFGDARPVEQPPGWRHFAAEARLLALAVPEFGSAIRALRQKGIKTEPAFWQALAGRGDPYAGMLALHDVSDDDLRKLLARAGWKNR